MIINPFFFTGVGPSYDSDAQAMFDARALVGDDPPAPYKQAISDFVIGLKAVSLWSSIIQLVVQAGATTVAGARISIKGNNFTNNNFVDADIDPKTGSQGNFGQLKRWGTGYTLSGRQNNHHAYIYCTSMATQFGAALFGSGGTAAGMSATFTSPTNLVWRSSNSTSSSLASGGPGGYGVNRTSSTGYQRLNVGATSTVTQTSVTPNTSQILVQARTSNANNPEGAFNGRTLIWAFGDGITTLADYTTPVNDFITALSAI